jgi:uncharacterized membrane protein YbhN (UPF0104 family)
MPGRLRRLLLPDAGPRRALRFGGVALFAAFAFLAVRTVDLAAVWNALAGGDPWLVAAAMGGNLLSLAAHAARWVALMPRGTEPRFRDAFSAMTAGFAVSIVVPARAGDAVRVWILSRRTASSMATVVAVTGLDYLLGAVTVVPLLAVLARVGPVPWARHVLLGFAAVSVAGIAAALWLRPRGGRASHAPGVGRLVTRLRAGLAAAGDPGSLARAGAWGVAGWGAELLVAHLSLAALGLRADAELSAAVVLAATAGGVVGVSPGAAGPYELAIVLVLGAAGIAREPALAAALLYHAAHLAPVAVIGALALLRELRAAPERPS